jgi:hypothetical protein
VSYETVRELQRTLYRAAKADGDRRFHSLGDKLYRPDVLERAWALVKPNKGSDGVDRQSIADIEAVGVEAFLAGIATELREGPTGSARSGGSISQSRARPGRCRSRP